MDRENYSDKREVRKTSRANSDRPTELSWKTFTNRNSKLYGGFRDGIRVYRQDYRNDVVTDRN